TGIQRGAGLVIEVTEGTPREQGDLRCGIPAEAVDTRVRGEGPDEFDGASVVVGRPGAGHGWDETGLREDGEARSGHSGRTEPDAPRPARAGPEDEPGGDVNPCQVEHQASVQDAPVPDLVVGRQ